MKKLYFLLLGLFALVAGPTYAGNLLGGEITYSCVAPNIYVVNFRYVQDCSTVLPPNFVNLKMQSPGCNPIGRTVALNKVGPYGVVTQTCANGLTQNCSPDNKAGNAFSVYYTGVVVFSAAEQSCQHWMLGVTVDAETRSASANLVGTPPLYLEAYLRLGPFINNSSLEYSPLNLPYAMVVYNQKSNYAFNAAEPDGDSIVFSFRPALQGAGNATATYQTPHTFQLPLPSAPAVAINNNNFSIDFKPSVFVPNSTPAQGQNRYVVVVQADEYRGINGVMELVGSTQREMIFDVREPVPTVNNIPKLAEFEVNGQPYSPLTHLVLTAGQPATVTFEATDLDSLDLVKLEMDTMGLGVGGLATIQVSNATNRPKVTIYFTPTAGHAQAGLYYLPVRLEDNSCPVKAITTEVLTFAVRSALGTRPEITANLNFSAYPNPFTEEIFFRFSAKANPKTILIYNLVGQEIDQIELKSGTIEAGKTTWKNAGKYAAGTYVAKLISENKTVQNIKFTKL